MLPVFGGFLLGLCHLGWVFHGGAGHCAFEVGPAAGGLHGFLEPHDEDCPVRAICFEVGNIGWELLNSSGWGGHFQVIQGAGFIVLDVGRAHNLWETRALKG
jgi:hypothetical protein